MNKYNFFAFVTGLARKLSMRANWRYRYLEVAGFLFDMLGMRYRDQGCVFEIPKQISSRRFRGRFLLKTHEWKEVRAVKKYLPADAKVLELGGGLGILAAIVNRRLTDPSAHCVVEPQPALQNVINRNKALNNSQFHLIHGVMGTPGKTTIHLRPNPMGAGLLRPTGQSVEVDAFSFDQIRTKADCDFDTILMDIEGGEYALLAGKEFPLDGIKLLIIELHPKIIGTEKCTEIRDALTARGFARIEDTYDVEVWSRP